MSSITAHNTRFKAPDAPNRIWVPENAAVSVIKWYDPHPSRRFGFIRPHDDRGDLWFNWLTLLKNKISEADVLPDMPVTFTFTNPDTEGKQRIVQFMRLDD
jgi:hypothetical protein